MSFGLTEFARAQDAAEVAKVAQNTMRDGHALRLQVSKCRNGDEAGDVRKRKLSSSKEKAKSKLLVRNVALETTRAEV